MLHAPDHARDFLRIQLGLSLGQSYHLHCGAEEIPGETINHIIYHHHNYQHCQPYHLHRGTEKVPSKTNNHIIYHHRYHYYQHCQPYIYIVAQ